MTENKFYILILTKDKFLKTAIFNSFSEEKKIEFVETVNKKTAINLVIFDNINQKDLLNKLIKQSLNLVIVNTSNDDLEVDCITIQKPFKINKLLFVINENFELNKNKSVNIITFLDCEVQTHNRVIMKDGKALDNLTEKEIEILSYLHKNKKVDKQILLDKVWNYSNLVDTKVVESNIYKLRQKFKKHNLQNPILFLDGYYELNKK